MTSDVTLGDKVNDEKTVSELYQCMLKIRMSEEKLAEIYPSDKIQSPVHLCIGQEAVSAGVCLALQKEDHIYGTYRGHGIYIAKGGNLKKMFAELYAKETGCAKGKGGSMHMAAPEVGLMGCSAIVASMIPVAVGDALAAKLKGEKRVVAAFFGDGAVDEGVFFESMNFAALKNLPVIFVCENNHYAIHSKVSDRHLRTELYRYGENLGVAGRRFDGNDVQVVYSEMCRAVREVRRGSAPLLLELMTYRWYEHVGPGQDHREAYRDQKKLQLAVQHDPLKGAKEFLCSRFHIPEKTFVQWENQIRKEVEAAVTFAEESSFPSIDHLTDDMYQESV